MTGKVNSLERTHEFRWQYRNRHGLSTATVDLKEAKHGTRSGYNSGCRCDPCTDAEMFYSRKRKQRKRK